MAKAAILLALHGLVRGQEVCSVSECRASALLQVEHNSLKVVLHRPHHDDKDKKSLLASSNKDVSSAYDTVTKADMKRQTQPLKDKLDDLTDRLETLEGCVDCHGSTDRRRSKSENLDEDYVRNGNDDEAGDNSANDDSKVRKKKRRKKRKSPDKNNNEGDNENEDENNNEGDKVNENENNNEGGNENENEEQDKDWADPDYHKRERALSDDYDWADPDSHPWARQRQKELSDRDFPDWGGMAPDPHWNGLEDVNALDSGPHASWKGEGTGVSSGKKYKGDQNPKGKYPYEMMMDVDYIIDSNPSSTGKEEKKSARRRRSSTSNDSGKHGPSHGGKDGPSNREKAPKSDGKTSPTHGGKTSEATDDKKAPREGKGKEGPKNEGKEGPKNGGKEGPENGGKESAESGLK